MKDNSISSGAGRLAVACRTCIQHARNIGISPKKNQTMKMHIRKLFRLPVLVSSRGFKLRHLRLGTQRRMFLSNLALLIMMGVRPTFANLVQEGSFESLSNGYGTGLMGPWTVRLFEPLNGDVGVYASGQFAGANVTDGNQAFDLGLGGYAHGNSISQVLPTVAGQTYRLSFDWGSEYALGTSAFVSVGDLNENLIDPVRGVISQLGFDQTPWIVYSSSFLFIASGNDILTFGEPVGEDNDNWGLVLDNIIVEPVNPPQLRLVPSGPILILSWPTNATGFVLESTTMLDNGGDWKDSNLTVTEINGQNIVTLTPIGPRAFFRLRGP